MNMQAKTADYSFKREPALSIARAAVAAGMARIERSASAAEHAATRWPFDRDAELILRAPTSPLDMANAAALVPIALAMLPMLAPYSAAARLFEAGLNLTLGRDAGAFVIPNLALTNVGFVAEGAPKPAVQGFGTGTRLEPRKIAGIAVLSSELFGQAFVETIMQRMLAESAGPALDAAVFSDAEATSAQPAGLLYGVEPITAATGADALSKDLGMLVASIAPSAGAGKIALIANWTQMVGLAVRTFRNVENVIVLTTDKVPVGTVIVVACNAIAAAMGVPTFETSTHASLTLDDAGEEWPGGSVTSLFQTASVGIKMVLDATWALRSSGADTVAWTRTVSW